MYRHNLEASKTLQFHYTLLEMHILAVIVNRKDITKCSVIGKKP